MNDRHIVCEDVDPDRLAVIAECIDNHEVGDPGAEWPNNIISRHAMAFASGLIARRGDGLRHEIDADELALCRRLSAAALESMAGADVGMGSNSGDPFRAFFVVRAIGQAVPDRIDEELVRSCFGGTIFPGATLTVEALAEGGVWWREVEADGEESEPEYFMPWRGTIRWFNEHPDFVATAFVRVGDDSALSKLPAQSWPEGTEITGCVLPRLMLGLTRGGSLAGLFGLSVQS